MYVKKLAALFVAALVIGAVAPQHVQAAEPTQPLQQQVVISEVQTGSALSANQEFIELYNQTDQTIAMAGWQLEYKSATGTAWNTKVTLAGFIEPRNYYLVATTGYIEANGVLSAGLAAAGGHVRLVQTDADDPTGQILDLLGWGTADSAEGGQSALAPEPGQSVQRCFAEALLVDTDNNGNDFKSFNSTPNDGVVCLPPEDEPPVISNMCTGILISEVLPNPAGADGGNEFIEIHNPTAASITLEGCSLQTTGTTKLYSFGADAVIEPGAYRTLYDAETGLTLPNTAGGVVYLLASDTSEAYAISYPPDLPDDVAWAWFGNNDWQITYTPSPGVMNVVQPLKPCAAGQERNEDTGQCRIPTPGSETAVIANLTPCRIGQERNPATNRCRSIAAAAAPTLTPCQPGQERNPETNRCRSTVTASAALKPCTPGQERNPETNRCRKVAGATTSNPVVVQDVAASTAGDMLGWWFAGIVGTGALGYAAYEWRQEISQIIGRLRSKILRVPPKG